MESKVVEDADELPGKLHEAIEGIGRIIRRLGERLKQAEKGSWKEMWL